MIRTAELSDAESIVNIYNHYVGQTIVTFDEQPLTKEDMMVSMQKNMDTYPWIVAQDKGEILGYAYGSQWRERESYRHTVETTVYLNNNHFGKGLGFKLYEHLLNDLRNLNYHVAMGVIALPNDPSIQLHEKLGFEKVAHFKEVGRKFDRWIDVGYWELML